MAPHEGYPSTNDDLSLSLTTMTTWCHRLPQVSSINSLTADFIPSLATLANRGKIGGNGTKAL